MIKSCQPKLINYQIIGKWFGYTSRNFLCLIMISDIKYEFKVIKVLNGVMTPHVNI